MAIAVSLQAPQGLSMLAWKPRDLPFVYTPGKGRRMSVEQLKHLIIALGTILVPTTSAWATQQSGVSAVGEQVEDVPQVPATPDQGNPGIGGSGTDDLSQGADGTALPSATRTTIFETELVGLWKHGAGSELSWVNSSGGYAGSQSVLYSESWDLHADMTYDHQFDGTSSIMSRNRSRVGCWYEGEAGRERADMIGRAWRVQPTE